jgi:hypothetical protein
MLGAGPQSRIRHNSVTAIVASVPRARDPCDGWVTRGRRNACAWHRCCIRGSCCQRGEPRRYMFEYSGPLPPSGGVNRPPLAVIAPHCTQFDGASFSCTVGPPSSRPIS